MLEYDGTNFFGWQRQDGERTVQGEIEKALAEFGEGAITVIGAGRTDAGVHALGQVAHFDLRRDFPLKTMFLALNAKVPRDIALKSVEIVERTFHARFSAQWRKYLYIISKYPTAIGRRFSWHPGFEYDLLILKSLAPKIVGKHDFAAFCKLKSRPQNAICTVKHAFWSENEAQVVFEIVADHFLHGMVRLMVGTMMDVARGRFSLADWEQIMKSGDVKLAGASAPAQGLFLAEVG
jgi:tRNA pseudouridine38-40 synthase